MIVTIEKDFRLVRCGSIDPFKDEHGNDRFNAVNFIDNVEEPFYDKDAAEHWLKLVGLNRG